MKISLITLGAVLVFAAGLWLGYRSGEAALAKAQAKAAETDQKMLTQSINAQIEKQQAVIDQQQADSAALAANQAVTRQVSADIQLEISHVGFTPANSTDCPDPVASDDFSRLYDSAATASSIRSADPSASSAQ